MNRLVHSLEGNLRSMQISGKKFFIFVEGGLDRSFVDAIMRRQGSMLPTDFEIRAARELPGSTGGKQRLIKHYKSLRRRQALHGAAFSKKFTTAFIFDKDIDELQRFKLRSAHAIYTETYDLEGHLFTCGDLAKAISFSSGITLDQAQNIIGDQRRYLARIAEAWADWIALCIVSKITGAHVGCTFEKSSALNNGIEPINAALKDQFMQKMAEKINVDTTVIERKFIRYLRVIKDEARAGNPLKFFRGKWMRDVLQQYTAKQISIPDATVDGLCAKVLTALVSQVGASTDCVCCSDIYQKLLPLRDQIS